MSKLPIKFCPTCSSKLNREPGQYDRNCIICKLPCGDDTQEAIHGHYVCSGDKSGGKRCDFHCCLSCYFGVDASVVVCGPFSCSNAQCERRAKDSAVVMCTQIRTEDHKRNPEVPYCWAWEGATAVARCPLCLHTNAAKSGKNTLPCFGSDCEGTFSMLCLGQPRGFPDRRRPRSSSPQNIKREPASSGGDDDDKEQQQ